MAVNMTRDTLPLRPFWPRPAGIGADPGCIATSPFSEGADLGEYAPSTR